VPAREMAFFDHTEPCRSPADGSCSFPTHSVGAMQGKVDETAMKNLRKRIWIDSFQTGLLLRIVLYCILYQVIICTFYIFCDQLDKSSAAMGVPLQLFSNTFTRSVLTLVLLVPPLAWDAVQFAHRLVGPLYRFRKTIQAMAAGESVSPIQLRKGDYLMDLKDDFNAMLQQLEQQGYVLVKRPEAKNAPAEATATSAR
jgi:hypothetical protein